MQAMRGINCGKLSSEKIYGRTSPVSNLNVTIKMTPMPQGDLIGNFESCCSSRKRARTFSTLVVHFQCTFSMQGCLEEE